MMPRREGIDHSALNWVKKELDETIRQSRLALEAFVGNPSDSSQLQFCVTYLHQARGTLQMIEVDGAALLAEELEALGRALVEGAVERKDEAYEVLMRGILQLPEYLDHVHAGHADVPMVLLPLLNDLRAVIGQPLLSEGALFNPDLSVPVPPPRERETFARDSGELRRLLRRLRHDLQLGLLSWYRDHDTQGGLERILAVVEHLDQLTQLEAVRRLWWISAGLIEAVRGGAVEASVSVKLLLGQVDRQIKRLIVDGEAVLAEELPADLLRNLLYYVARAGQGGERVRALKEAFDLDRLLPDEGADGGGMGPGIDSLRAVSEAVKEDLTAVKDGLDLYVRSEPRNPEDLARLPGTLRRSADTFGMLGLGKLRRIAQEQAQRVEAIVQGDTDPGEEEFTEIASGILEIEASLDLLAHGAVTPEAERSSEEEAPPAPAGEAGSMEAATPAVNPGRVGDSEFRLLVLAMAREAAENVARIKEAVVAQLQAPGAEGGAFDDVPKWLGEVKGSFQILNLARAAEAVQRLSDYVTTTLAGRSVAPSSDDQEALADVIAGIEYYLEAVVERRSDRETILDRVEVGLDRLAVPADPNGGNGGGPGVGGGVAASAVPAVDEVPGAEPDALRDSGEEDPFAGYSPLVEEEPSAGDESGAEEEREEFPGSDGVDGGEVILPAAWDAQESDVPAPEPEYEAPQTLEPFSLLDAEEVEDAGGDPAGSADAAFGDALELDVSMEVEAAPAAPEGVTGDEAPGDAPGAAEVAHQASEPPPEPPLELCPVLGDDADPEILQIFLEEADDELASLREQLPQWRAEPEDREAAGTIRRSFHTLKGSGRLSGALRVGEFAWALESLLNRVLEGAVPAAPGVFAAVDEAIELLPGLIGELRDGEGCRASEVAALMERAGALARGEDPGETAAGAGNDVGVQSHAVADTNADASVDDGSSPVALPPVLAEDVDPEILGIFLEEAEEELASLREQLPQWRAEPEDREAAGTIRRSFHTLKGSGRLGGALRVGEFAWALESLLNRVLEGAVPAAPGVFAAVDEAIELLPGLIGELRDGEGCRASEVAALMERAGALARGEESGETASEPAPESAQGADAGAPPTEPVEPDADPEPEAAQGGDAGEPRIADPVLYETFSQEVNDHLAVVDTFLARCREQGEDCRIGGDLARAFHTLHGSAYMAGVPEIAEVAGMLEKLVQLPGVAGAVRDLELDALLADSVALIRAQLAALARPGDAPAEPGPMLERIERAAQSHLAQMGSFAGPEVAAARWDEDVSEAESATAAAPEPAPASVPEVDEAEPVPEPASAPEPMPRSVPDPAPVAEAVPAPADDLAGELAEIFMEEAEELLAAAEDTLQSWEQHPEEVRWVTELQRELHTLKGGARMADIAAIADLSHAMESLLSAVVDGHVEATRGLFETLHATVDQLHTMHEGLRGGAAPTPAPELVAELESVRAGRPAGTAPPASAAPTSPVGGEESAEPEASGDADASEESEEADASEGAGEAEESAAQAVPEEPAFEGELEEPVPAAEGGRAAMRIERRTAPRVQSESVRVRADLLDNLVNYAGEVSIYRSRMEQQTAAIRFNLVEFDQTVARLREQLRRLEIETEAQILYRHEVEVEAREDFDPLELDRYSQVQHLSRGLAESVNDLVSIQGLLDHLARESETLLLQQSRVNTDLQEGLMRTRMVPFAGLVPRLRRIVRQTCTTLGKRAELKVQGAEGEMDRTVLDRLVAPMEHMLRNAISHGIETPEARRAAGKPEGGTVLLRLAREGSEVVIRVSDDGAGIDLEAIRRKAVERGLLAEGAEISDHDVMQFILESGFSTARTLTQISGRGVGMDVVNSEIKQLGGQLDIDSRAGRGMTFTIRLPFTLAVAQALLVYVSDEVYAIPLSSVEGIVRLGYDEISRCMGAQVPTLEYAGQEYQLIHMGALLGIASPPVQADRKVPVLLVRSGDHQSAVLVDGLLGSREIVVKSVGPQLSTVRGISGATILGDGRVVLIVDAGALVRLSAALAAAELEPEPEPEYAGRITVMVVDDSITVRKVTTRLLERHDIEVITAKDGVDAVAVLQEHIPDVMLLDIEMPRMDGFELATHMRNEERLRGIPIIMITSRTGQKHREHAMRIGVNRYLGKPYQEGELLENIHALLNERAGHGSA